MRQTDPRDRTPAAMAVSPDRRYSDIVNIGYPPVLHTVLAGIQDLASLSRKSPVVIVKLGSPTYWQPHRLPNCDGVADGETTLLARQWMGVEHIAVAFAESVPHSSNLPSPHPILPLFCVPLLEILDEPFHIRGLR